MWKAQIGKSQNQNPALRGLDFWLNIMHGNFWHRDTFYRKEEKLKLIEELITKNETEINMMSPLTWAYVGDSVYELYIRTYLSNTTNLNPHKLHVLAIKYVKASAQANILHKLELTEDEKEIAKRGRNAENHHLPKNATIEEYMYSTAFESLIGYLFLTKQNERLKEILKQSIAIAEM